MKTVRTLTLGRVVAIYVLGLVAGVQGALYLYDRFDDGVSEPLSGFIALAFLGAGAAVIARTFRRPPE
jgi:ABC-type uncharacterized transport system permease subunit